MCSKSILISIMLSSSTIATAVVGDRICLSTQNRLIKAFADNITHWLIGFFSWFNVFYYLRYGTFFDIVLCGMFSSAIDIDHFIEARSLHLQDAVSLTTRPFLHCSSIPVVVCGLGLILAYLCNWFWLQKVSFLLIVAFSTHHVRDSARRGLWFWPLGSTPALPYYLYIFILIVIPYLLIFSIKMTSTKVSALWHHEIITV